MIRYNVNNIFPDYHFYITGVSYVGMPKSNTAMYISCKIGKEIQKLENVENCLVYAEKGVEVSDKIKNKNAIIYAENPELEYARLALILEDIQKKEDKKENYIFYPGGYYVSETAKIGEGAYIEQGCIIGEHVVIGRNAKILSNTVLKHAIIGDNFFCGENAVIGCSNFTMTKDEEGNNYRIPALGNVIVGNNVEVGANSNINRGSCGDTKLDDYVKLDGMVHIGHESHLCANVRIAAGATVAGFVVINEQTYVGVNASIKNRIVIGKNCLIGMGTVVILDVKDGYSVFGSPARKIGQIKD